MPEDYDDDLIYMLHSDCRSFYIGEDWKAGFMYLAYVDGWQSINLFRIDHRGTIS